jgi:hypothetical protein
MGVDVPLIEGGGGAALAAMWREVYRKAAEVAEARTTELLRQHVYLYPHGAGGGGAGGLGWVLLYEHQVTAGAGESVLRLPDSGTLAQTHGTLVVELRARSTSAGTDREAVFLELNGLNAHDYTYSLTRTDAGAVTGFASGVATGWDIGACPRAGAAAGHWGYATVHLPMYASVGGTRKGYLASAETAYGSTSSTPYLQQAGGFVVNTGPATTALFLRPGSGAFTEGTLVRVWGVSDGA